MENNKIKILIVDDHNVVRKGLITLFEDENDFEIIGEAADGLEALDKLKTINPDIVLLDISMPNLNGIETAEMIDKSFKAIKTIIFSMHDNEDYIVKAVESGALGYLLKDAPKEEILSAIRIVNNGQKYFNTQISSILVNGLINKPKKAFGKNKDTFKISKKEKLVLKHLINGLNSKEIAEKLELSVRTVDNHRAHMMKKTGVKNSIELVRLAMKEGLV